MKVFQVISLTLYLYGLVLLVFLMSTLSAYPIELSSFLPQLMSIHETCKTLAQTNNLLKAKILDELASNNKTQLTCRDKSTPSLNSSSLVYTSASSTPKNNNYHENVNKTIDYVELEVFNKWVGDNLDYAIKNTLATAEALKDEASENNGTVDYSMSFIEDGQNGVKYWKSAVLFQDKTLKNESFDIDSISKV